MSWMIYGAYGYTARKIVAHAVAASHRPLLAGRNAAQLKAMAAQYDLDYIVLNVGDSFAIAQAVAGVKVLLNAAGPFNETALPLLEACIAGKTHYVDITGDMPVMESLLAEHERASAAGITVCPACGFDVIPTDCLAASLAGAMLDATHFTLSLDSNMAISPGSAKSALGLLALGCVVRRNGVLTQVSRSQTLRHIEFPDHTAPIPVAAVPWGDLVSAWLSTGIPNIEVLLPLRAGRLELWLEPLMRLASNSNLIRRWLTAYIDTKVPVPSDEELDNTSISVWGEVRNKAGKTIRASMKGPNGYKLTIEGALVFVEALLDDNADHPRGYVTPSNLLGANVATEKLGCSPIIYSAISDSNEK